MLPGFFAVERPASPEERAARLAKRDASVRESSGSSRCSYRRWTHAYESVNAGERGALMLPSRRRQGARRAISVRSGRRGRWWSLAAGARLGRGSIVAAAVLVSVGAAAGQPAWPHFLPPDRAVPPELIIGIQQVWSDPTFIRHITGHPAYVPIEVYTAFLDAPDVTVRAAQFLKLAKYELRVVAEGWYEGRDGDGGQGSYRVLLREPNRQVGFSWGENRDMLMGTIRGRALTLLDLTEHGGKVEQQMTVYARIDNNIAATFARIFVAIFGGIADRKLSQGVAVTATVAEWALAHPAEFCDWLDGEPFTSDRTARVRALLCEATVASRMPPGRNAAGRAAAVAQAPSGR